MITHLSHATIYVLDQEEAKNFYVDKLGFELKTDFTMDTGFRWLTVSTKDQPDVEIVLMAIQPGFMFDEETANQIKGLAQKGALGSGVFRTTDCHATYEELKAKGVEFIAPPEDKFYGIEAVFKDNSGNWFSLTQPKEGND